MISIIIPYFEDTLERDKNLNIITRYYNSIFPTAQILVERGTDKIFNKCLLYNSGAKKASNDVLCFVDSDTIVSKPALEESARLAGDTNNVVVGYSGVAIYLSYHGKELIGETPGYDDILNNFKDLELGNYYSGNKYYEIGNTRAVGGCLFMNKQCFIDINGYNPNFLGWGYEDNEVVLRSHKLGKNVVWMNNPFSYLFHLPHHDVDVDKSVHTHYTDNYNEYVKMQKLSSEEIEIYKETWKI